MVNSHANTVVLWSMVRIPNTQVSPNKGRRITVAFKVVLLTRKKTCRLISVNIIFLRSDHNLSRTSTVQCPHCTHKVTCMEQYVLYILVLKCWMSLFCLHKHQKWSLSHLAKVMVLAFFFNCWELKWRCLFFQRLLIAKHRKTTLIWGHNYKSSYCCAL